MARIFEWLRKWATPREILPEPDRSVYRGPYLCEKQMSYLRRLWRQM